MVADELRRHSDQFIDLADLETVIGRDPAARPAREPRAYAGSRATSSSSAGPAGSGGRSTASYQDYDVSEEEV
jgi:hypothetical protein